MLVSSSLETVLYKCQVFKGVFHFQTTVNPIILAIPLIWLIRQILHICQIKWMPTYLGHVEII